jgi:type IV pilus assembly protein PilE
MKQQGFTLIELMIVVVLVAIMAMIAVPAFNDSVVKARRADGQTALIGLQLEIEKYRGSCSTYPQAIDTAGDDCVNNEVGYADESQEGHYKLKVAHTDYPSTGNAYRIEAEAQGDQKSKEQSKNSGTCVTMRITVSNTNPKGLKEPADCW